MSELVSKAGRNERVDVPCCMLLTLFSSPAEKKESRLPLAPAAATCSRLLFEHRFLAHPPTSSAAVYFCHYFFLSLLFFFPFFSFSHLPSLSSLIFTPIPNLTSTLSSFIFTTPYFLLPTPHSLAHSLICRQ